MSIRSHWSARSSLQGMSTKRSARSWDLSKVSQSQPELTVKATKVIPTIHPSITDSVGNSDRLKQLAEEKAMVQIASAEEGMKIMQPYMASRRSIAKQSMDGTCRTNTS